AGVEVDDHDQAVGVAYGNTKRATGHAGAALRVVHTTPAPLVRAVVRVIVGHRVRVRGVHHVEHLQAVFIGRDEHVGPAYLVIVCEALPPGRPRTDRPGNS